MSIDPRTHQTLLAIRDDLYTKLVAAQAQRRNRGHLVDTANGMEWGFVIHERFVMQAATNQWRARNGFDAVDHVVIERAEGQAVGHVDYTAKFALYCAEIALGLAGWDEGR